MSERKLSEALNLAVQGWRQGESILQGREHLSLSRAAGERAEQAGARADERMALDQKQHEVSVGHLESRQAEEKAREHNRILTENTRLSGMMGAGTMPFDLSAFTPVEGFDVDQEVAAAARERGLRVQQDIGLGRLTSRRQVRNALEGVPDPAGEIARNAVSSLRGRIRSGRRETRFDRRQQVEAQEDARLTPEEMGQRSYEQTKGSLRAQQEVAGAITPDQLGDEAWAALARAPSVARQLFTPAGMNLLLQGQRPGPEHMKPDAPAEISMSQIRSMARDMNTIESAAGDRLDQLGYSRSLVDMARTLSPERARRLAESEYSRWETRLRRALPQEMRDAMDRGERPPRDAMLAALGSIRDADPAEVLRWIAELEQLLGVQ